MNKKELLLTMLMEECCEVAQRCAKALRFGLKEVQPGQKFTNEERIQDELDDIIVVQEMLNNEGVFGNKFESKDPLSRIMHKRKFLAYSLERQLLKIKEEG